jgi:hypothetical protein
MYYDLYRGGFKKTRRIGKLFLIFVIAVFERLEIIDIVE